MSNKVFYRQYCQEHHVPIYLHSEWLDIVAQEHGDWDVLISKNSNDEILGYWVYYFKQQWFWKKLTMPPFIPYMGPVLLYPKGLSTQEKISFEHKVLSDLMDKMPKFDDIRWKWKAGYENWLPFYWNGYQQQTAYTYIIEDTADAKKVFDQFKPSLQRQIKKALRNLKVRHTKDTENLLRLFAVSMQSDSSYQVPFQYLQQLISVAQKYDRCIILESVNEDERVLGAILVLTDAQEMLYLLGGYDHTYNDSGAMPLLFWQALQLAGDEDLQFNFEGSMIPGVEKFFRSFGGELKPVFQLTKSKFPYNIIDLWR